MMTDTEELRRMLDERDVGWRDEYNAFDYITKWHANGIYADFSEDKGLCEPNLLVVYYEDITPAQAIAATLGEREDAIATNPHATCVVLEGENPPEEVLYHGANEVTHYLPERTCNRKRKPNCMVCSECHYVLNDEWLYCPHCGARIEVDQDACDLHDAIENDDGKRYSMSEVMEMMKDCE